MTNIQAQLMIEIVFNVGCVTSYKVYPYFCPAL